MALYCIGPGAAFDRSVQFFTGQRAFNTRQRDTFTGNGRCHIAARHPASPTNLDHRTYASTHAHKRDANPPNSPGVRVGNRQ